MFIEFCKRNLADCKIPKEFIFIDDVPMTPAGKIQTAALKKQYFETINKLSKYL